LGCNVGDESDKVLRDAFFNLFNISHALFTLYSLSRKVSRLT